MSISGVDAKFINSVVNGLKKTNSRYVPCSTRSSVAIIFRFGDGTEENNVGSKRNYVSDLFSDRWVKKNEKIDPSEVAQRLMHNMKLDAPSTLQVLFLKRADIDDDRWSGAVSFPGGRRDLDDDDDFATAKREAYDELGIPLDSPDFLLLGKLPDYKIMSRQTINEGVVQTRFVFLHVGTMSPVLKFASHEVESIQWYPLSKLNAQNVEKKRVMHGVTQFIRSKTPDSRLLASELFGGTFAYFPSLRINNKWNVWGLPLRSISELLEMDNRPAVDWPMFSVNNPVYQFIIVDAYHGYRELSDRMPKKFLRHQFALFFDVFVIFVCCLAVADALNVIGFMISIATGLKEDEDAKASIKSYYEKNPPRAV